MAFKTPAEIIGRFGSLKKDYITPTSNKPFNDLDLREIEDMLKQVNDWGRQGMDEVKEALGFSSYEKAMQGDYSEFERVHPVLRNYHAMQVEKSHRNTMVEINEWKNSGIPEYQALVGERLRPYLYNPALRLGMSIMKDEPLKDRNGKPLKDEQGKEVAPFYKELDDLMIDSIMEDTLKPMTEQQIRNVNAMADSPQQAQEMIEKNVEKQVQMAKMMLMAHIGDTKLMNDNKEPMEMNRSVSSMMAHCSRTAFVFPRGDEKDVSEMMGKLTGAKMGKAAGIYGRFAATHSTAHGKTFADFKEKKTISLRHQYGMDVAIGGLGNGGISGRGGVPQTLKQDGTCGHMYMRVDQGGKDKTSSLLIGFESDSPSAVGNQQGHIHDAKATPEYMSSFLGQRVDEMGAKYGGRTVDCTMYQPHELSMMLNQFTSQYRGMVYEAMKNPEARIRLEQANKMLSGTLMKPDQLETCLNKAGLAMDQAQVIAQISANKKDMDYQMDTSKVGERAVKPIMEYEKPSKRVRFKAYFGNTLAKKQVKDYQDAKVDRKEAAKKVAMSFSDFSKEASKDSPAKKKVETKKPLEKTAPTIESKKKSWNPFSKK